ncbi:hypothetical protein MHI39_07285 [Heyndrickxia sp. FSL K6-6286]|uniref:hypothetical protein n=1 Tax=Heyndrickxia sp. FSL K6-6286 TaxID=2921510 RepID=UPI00315A7B93
MFAVVNIEQLETKRFIVVNIYDDEMGFLIDQVIRPFESCEQVIEVLREVGTSHVWTSDRQLYGLLLQTVGIGAEIKHHDDTRETRQVIEGQRELLTELFDIPPMKPKPKLPRWRRWLYVVLTKFINKIGGNGKYDIGI